MDWNNKFRFFGTGSNERPDIQQPVALPTEGELAAPLDNPTRWKAETFARNCETLSTIYEQSSESIALLERISIANQLIRTYLSATSSHTDKYRRLLVSDDACRSRLGLGAPLESSKAAKRDINARTYASTQTEGAQFAKHLAVLAQAWINQPHDINRILNLSNHILSYHHVLHEMARHTSYIMQALETLGKHAEPTIPNIIASADPYNAKAACDALAAMGPKGLPALVKLANHYLISATAIETLASFGKASVPVLTRLVSSERWDTVINAAKALSLFGEDAIEAAPTLYAKWQSCRDIMSKSKIVNNLYDLHNSTKAELACRTSLKCIRGVNYFDVTIGLDYDAFINENTKRNALTTPESSPLPPPRRTVNPRQSVLLDSLMETVPSGLNYDELTRQLGEINHELKERFIERLQPVLNAEAQGRPHETFEQKKELASWINDELAKLGLAVKFPKDDRPARLAGDIGNRTGVGRFQFQVYENGKLRRANSDILPELELTDASPPPSWQNKEDERTAGRPHGRGKS